MSFSPNCRCVWKGQGCTCLMFYMHRIHQSLWQQYQISAHESWLSIELCAPFINTWWTCSNTYQGGDETNKEPFQYALDIILGYCPKIVHLAAADLEGTWRDMMAIGAALEQTPRADELVYSKAEQCVDRFCHHGFCFFLGIMIATVKHQVCLDEFKNNPSIWKTSNRQTNK